MEFWGIEVKPGHTVKCEAGNESIVHLSQASLGEIKKEKGSEYVPIFVKFNDQKLVIGNLSADKCAQIQYDLIFEKEFELSHGSKHTSVFFVGYKRVNEIVESDDSFDDSSSDDDLHIDEGANGIAYQKKFGKLIAQKATTSKDDNVAAKLKANLEKLKKELVKADKKAEYDDDEDDDKNDSEEDSDKDEEIIESSGDSSEEDEDDSSEEETPQKKVEKKRKSDSASKTLPRKKAKVVTPVENHKAVGDGKKAYVHVATPYPAKQVGKHRPSSKSDGSVACKTCNSYASIVLYIVQYSQGIGNLKADEFCFHTAFLGLSTLRMLFNHTGNPSMVMQLNK